jgi:hypothetical protein
MMPPVEQRLRELLHTGQGDLPRPGQGSTLARWRALSLVAAENLSLAKLFEGHTDALAIMAELGATAPESSTVWGTWAAEPPQARVRLRTEGDRVRLSGRKAWCSGAAAVTDALVTAWDAQDRQCLAAVSMKEPGVTVTTEGWHAVGMAAAASPDVVFDDAVATMIGAPGDYVSRPGFWQGGGGIAACWYGGALPLARAVASAVQRRSDPHVSAQLGTMDIALRSLRALFVEAAGWIDEHPADSAMTFAFRLRSAADDTATLVLRLAGRALGAGPLCRDAEIAQRYADLPVFIRQTHAEHDLAELGRLVAPDMTDWAL